jgi:hypothetical protein
MQVVQTESEIQDGAATVDVDRANAALRARTSFDKLAKSFVEERRRGK